MKRFRILAMAKRRDNWLTDLTTGMTATSILFNPAVMILGVSVATIAVSIHLWNLNLGVIQQEENFALSVEKIALDEPPKWVDTKLHQSIVNEITDNGQSSLLDAGLVESVATKFQRMGWVEGIEQIRKSRMGLDIKLNYRLPVGVVELNQSNAKNWGSEKEKLIPIDRQGVILPIEATQEVALMRITVFEPRRGDRLETWSTWQDERILDCAKIGEYLSSRWQEYGFFRITTLRPPINPSESNIPYQLWTGNRHVATKVIWGNSPGKEVVGEASSAQKLQALEALVAEYGPLDSIPAATIDLRSGKARISREKVADSQAFGGTLIN